MVQQRDATMPLSASPSFLPASFGGRHRRNTDNPRRIIPQTRRQSKVIQCFIAQCFIAIVACFNFDCVCFVYFAV